jgi:type IV secretory pathway VirJ component
MFGKAFPTKRIAISAIAFAVVAVGGMAAVSVVPALAAGSAVNAGLTASTASPAPTSNGHPVLKAIATRRIALALFRTSVTDTGLSRITVLKDLLSGETLAQIDGSKAQTVENAVMAKVTTKLNKAVTAHKITQAQATTLSADAKTGISKLMNLNLSTYLHVRFGGFDKTPATTPTSPAAAATGSSTAV